MENYFKKKRGTTFNSKLDFIVGELIQPSICTFPESSFAPKKPFFSNLNFKIFFSDN